MAWNDLPLRRRRAGVERVLLGLHRPAGADARPARVALGEEPAHAGRRRRRQQVIEALRAQLVGGREGAVEVLQVQVRGEGRHLVDDHLRLGPGHGLAHGQAVQPVQQHRLGARVPQSGQLALAAGGRGHLVARPPPAAAPGAVRPPRSLRLRIPSWSAPFPSSSAESRTLRRRTRARCDSRSQTQSANSARTPSRRTGSRRSNRSSAASAPASMAAGSMVGAASETPRV